VRTDPFFLPVSRSYADYLSKAGCSRGCVSAIVELDLAIRGCGDLPRQASETFPKFAGCENKHSTGSNYIFTCLLYGRPKRAGGKSAARRRLSWRQHCGRAEFPFEPYERHLQYRSRNILASKPCFSTSAATTTRPWDVRPVLTSAAAAMFVSAKEFPARLVSMTAPISAM
jgi:hypothetical protein